ncbi:MAG: site-specific integrase [Phycisphaerales bacterium]|nr:site-specific integrase [Phycisphaerales bacterium]
MDHIAQPARVEQFLNYLQYERHFSSYTSRCYGADLRQFCQFLLGIPAEIMPDDIEPGMNGNGHLNGNGDGGVAVAVIEQLPKVDTSPEHSEELLQNASAEDVRT